MYMYIYSPFCTNDIHAKIRMRFSHIYMVHYCFVFFKAWLGSKSKASKTEPSQAAPNPNRTEEKYFLQGFVFFSSVRVGSPSQGEPSQTEPSQSKAMPHRRKRHPPPVFP